MCARCSADPSRPEALRTTSAAEVRTGRSGRQSTAIVSVEPESVRCSGVSVSEASMRLAAFASRSSS